MYVLLLDQIERQVMADRQVAAVFVAAGAKDVSLPDLREQQERFDAALIAEPTLTAPVDVEQLELRRALGVA